MVLHESSDYASQNVSGMKELIIALLIQYILCMCRATFGYVVPDDAFGSRPRACFIIICGSVMV